MDPISQLVLRSEDRLGHGALTLIEPARDQLARHLDAHVDELRVSTTHHGDFSWFDRQKIEVRFEPAPTGLNDRRTVILRLPREKKRLAMNLHAIAAEARPELRLWVVGEKRAGIKSAASVIERFFSQVEKRDNARHCSLLEACHPRAAPPFDLNDYLHWWPFTHQGHELSIAALPGVFAHGRLDQGSALLLRAMQDLTIKGRVLDFACGSGVIGAAALATQTEIDLTCLDVSSLAIAATEATLQANDMRARVVSSDGLENLQGRFDWIISNPPFHRGVDNDLDIAKVFFADAGTFLSEKGRMLIVFNRHLPYARWLSNHFKQVEYRAQNREFTVMMASN